MASYTYIQNLNEISQVIFSILYAKMKNKLKLNIILYTWACPDTEAFYDARRSFMEVLSSVMCNSTGNWTVC